MLEKGIEIERLKLAPICTVCSDRFVEEINKMSEIVQKGPAISPS